MSRRLGCVVTLCLFLSASLYAQNTQRILEVDSEVYELIELLYLESSRTPPFPTLPSTAEELLLFLDLLDLASLSELGRETYLQLKEQLASEGEFQIADTLSVEANVIGTVEAYVKQNPDSLWQHGYEERQSMARFPVEFWFLDSLYAKMDLSMTENPGMVSVSDNYTNVFSGERNFAELDWNVPLNTVVSLGNTHWNIVYGRHQMKWGAGTTGDLLVSDFPDYYDNLTAHLYWDNFKYTVTYINMDAFAAGDETEPYFIDAYKAFYAHRFDVRMFDVVRLSLTESIMFGNRRPELRQVNPFFVFHNLFPDKYGNVGVLLELAVTPMKGLNLYGELASTEIETKLDGPGRPTSMGYLVGALASTPTRIGYMGLNAEYVHTDPWLYNRDTNLTKYTYHRLARSNFPNPREWIVKPFGYYLGPDTRMIFVGASLQKPKSYSVELGLYHYVQGELSLDVEYLSLDDNYVSTPSGDTSRQNVFQLSADYTPLSGLYAGLDLYVLWSGDETALLPSGGWDLQFAPYLSVDVLELVTHLTGR